MDSVDEFSRGPRLNSRWVALLDAKREKVRNIKAVLSHAALESLLANVKFNSQYKTFIVVGQWQQYGQDVELFIRTIEEQGKAFPLKAAPQEDK